MGKECDKVPISDFDEQLGPGGRPLGSKPIIKRLSKSKARSKMLKQAGITK